MKALEDAHAYVRGSAALALGRMRATEAKDKLEYTMKEDGPQPIPRSRGEDELRPHLSLTKPHNRCLPVRQALAKSDVWPEITQQPGLDVQPLLRSQL